MFKAKLQTSYQNLTQSEKQIADYIIEHLDEIKTITSHQLATLTTTETSRKVIAQYKDILDITINNNNEITIENIAKLLINTKKIIIFGVGSSNLFCDYLANQLIKLGLTCITSQSSHTIYSLIDQAIPQETALILLSESGETADVIKSAEIAKNCQIPIVVVTSNTKNTLHNYADYLLKTVSFGAKTRLNVTTMRCSQLLLIDLIYLNILKLDYQRFNQLIERAEVLSDKL